LETLFVQPGFFMTVLYLEALAAHAASLSVVTAGARVVQQRLGAPGWVATICTFSFGFAGAGRVLRPVVGGALNARQWLVAPLASSTPTRESRVSAKWRPAFRIDHAQK
jgi:hypothetical protein